MDSLSSSTDRPRFYRTSTTSATSTTSVNSPLSSISTTSGPLQPQRVSSVDSLHHPNSYHALRKRHSAYALSQSDRLHQQLPPLPDLPNIPLNILNQHNHQGPQRPPRNPARSGTHVSDLPPLRKTTSRSRPSTASDSREEVTPWEFQSIVKDKDSERRGPYSLVSTPPSTNPAYTPSSTSAAPSMKSRASSLGLSINTGPISEVTPWELYPIPPTQSNLSTVSTRTSLSVGSVRSANSADVAAQASASRAHSTSISSINIPYVGQRNGGSTQITRTTSGPGRSNGAESGQPGTPVMNTSASPLPPLTPLRSAHSNIGPIEDVTPWELEPGPTTTLSSVSKPENEQYHDRSSTSKYIRLRTSVSSSSRPFNVSKTSIHQPPPLFPPPLPHTQLRQSTQPPQSPSRKSLARSETSVSQSSAVGTSTHWTHSTHTPGSGTRPLPTGPTEEVTPWELEPIPVPKKSATVEETEILAHVDQLRTVHPRNSLSLTTAQLEEVTPWELYPVPGDPVGIERKLAGGSEQVDGGNTVKNKRSTRSSTTTSHIPKSFSDFGLRRRRSTGTKGRSSTGTNGSSVGLGIAGGPGVSGPSVGSSKGISSGDLPRSPARTPGPSSIVVTSSTSSSMPGSLGLTGSFDNIGPIPLAPASSISSIPSTSSHPSRGNTQTGLKSPATSNTLRFSTADRTILQELKASIQARDAQFVLKGIGTPIVGGGKSQGKKHHCYHVKDVPYPRSYEREVIDLDVWEIMFGVDSCQSYTWHIFKTPPTKVLEIGCGTGTWVLQCARQWKDSHFVGLDIVPLHPNLQNVGSPDLASRVTWVQHNFLEGLPFPNEEFDFVHIKRIALGVPEDKWDALFEEITRVMKPGGAFEMIEEDLFFPGKPVNESGKSSPVDTSPVSKLESTATDKRRKPTIDPLFPPPSPSGSSLKTSGTETVPSSPVQSRHSLRHLEDVGEESAITWPLPPSSAHHSTAPSLALSATSTLALTPSRTGNARSPPPMPKPATRPTLSVKTHHGSDPNGQLANGYGASLSVFGVMAYQPDPMLESVLKQRGRSSSTMTGASSASPHSASGLVSPGRGLGDGASSLYGKKTKPSPFLLRTLTKAPNDPRDHTILTAIWYGMLGSRFINTTPLSLLAATLEYHFKNVRTHPPLLCTFPPVVVKPKRSKENKDHHSDSEDDMDEARHSHAPYRRSSSRAAKVSTPADEQARTADQGGGISLHGLLSHASPYISLDDDRMVGISPLIQANLPAIQASNDPSPLVAARPSVLPNTSLNIDLRALNMHLMLRVKEILASAESMWEWVQDFQAAHSSAPRTALRGPPSTPSTGDSSNLSTHQILELTRDDFDILLSNFELDMQDRTGIDQVIEDRFNWHVFTSPDLQDRKVFDATCEKFDNWAAEQRAQEIPSRQGLSRLSGVTHRTPGSVATSITVPSTPDTITRNFHGTESEHGMEDVVKLHPISPVSSLYPTPEPSQMLSRAMRVFVAWKPDT